MELRNGNVTLVFSLTVFVLHCYSVQENAAKIPGNFLIVFTFQPNYNIFFFNLNSCIVNSMYCLQEIAEHVFGYQVENVLKVKTFQFRGTTPFAAANDHYVIKCMTKVFNRN